MVRSIEKAEARKKRKAERNCFSKRATTVFKKAELLHVRTGAKISVSITHKGRTDYEVFG
jgi:hypothetical protein